MCYLDPLRYKTEVTVLWKNGGMNYFVLKLLLTPIELTKIFYEQIVFLIFMVLLLSPSWEMGQAG